MEVEPRRKYWLAGEPALTNPLFDQSFDKQNSSAFSNDAKVQVKPKGSPRSQSSRDFAKVSPKKPLEKPLAPVEKSKVEEKKKKKVEYVGKSGELYEFLKGEYQKRRGISFSIGGIHVDSKMSPAEVEKRKKEEATKRANVLVDFWKQYFVKKQGKSVSGSRVLDESRKSETNAAQKEQKERIKTYSEDEVAFTLTQDILKEINEAMAKTEKSKLQAKVLEENAKLEEEKRMFQKALNFHYGFERENLQDKEYMQVLVWTYREVKMKFPVDGKELYEWWLEYPKKEGKKIDKDKEYTKDLVGDFYSDRAKVNRLEQLYKGVNKYFPKQASDLIKYWKTIKPVEHKDALVVNGPDMERVIEQHYAAKEEEKQREEFRKTQEAKKAKEKREEQMKRMTAKRAEGKKIWDELAAPKDKWKVGRTLLELQKQFPMDEIVRRMVKEEFKTNKVFRYPEEYQVYEEEEEVKRKLKKAEQPRKLSPNEYINQEAVLKEKKLKKLEELKRSTIAETAAEKEKRLQRIRDREVLTSYLQDAIKDYFKAKEKRLEEHTGTLRNYIGEQYVKMTEKYPSEMERTFPFPNYGAAEPESGKKRKIYPKEFKMHFLDILRGYVAVRKGKYVKAPKKNVPFWIPSSKPCPASDKGLSLGESTVKSANAKGRKKKFGPSLKELDQFHLHAWNRRDEAIAEKKQRIMMTYSDIQNCTFKPHVTPYYGGGQMPKREEEIDPNEIAKNMGKNFEKSYPYVFKSGVYNKALTFFQKGMYVDAMNKLREGFNIESLKRNFHPNYETYKK